MTAPREAMAAALRGLGDHPGGCPFEPYDAGDPDHHGPEFTDAILAALAASGWVLRREGEVERLREALRDARSALVSEHGHDSDGHAPWPSCLPVHIALNRARAALDGGTADG